MRCVTSGTCTIERITISEATGTVTFNTCDANGIPGDAERALAMHTPPCLELFERSVSSGLRLDCQTPAESARDTVLNIERLAMMILDRPPLARD
eukprot:UN1025